MTRLLAAIAVALLALNAAGCGRERPGSEPVDPKEEITDEQAFEAFEEVALQGRVRLDGSSTLAPLVTVAAEGFGKANPGVSVTVGIAGTGGGFERFCRGETDVANASRPIDEEEEALCRRNGVRFLELHVANDGLSVVVNPGNDWADCLTVDQLKRIWEPGSSASSWDDIDERFPSERLILFGPGTDSGTFDYFTDAVVGEAGMSRSDYTTSEDDNVAVRGVSAQRGALGYLGLSYLEENADRLRAVAIDDGKGCVEPSAETVQSGEYTPLSRPLYVYASRDAIQEKLQVDAFLTYLVENQRRLTERALFVPLTEDQLERTRTVLEGASIETDDDEDG